MTRHAVAALKGDALDYAVGLAMGWTRRYAGEFNAGRWMIGRDMGMMIAVWRPSRFWEQAGPIIENELLGVRGLGAEAGDQWCAWVNQDMAWYGPTPLIAAMRAFVASKLGALVDLPDDLFQLPGAASDGGRHSENP